MDLVGQAILVVPVVRLVRHIPLDAILVVVAGLATVDESQVPLPGLAPSFSTVVESAASFAIGVTEDAGTD